MTVKILNDTDRLVNGHWEVGLLWKTDETKLVDSHNTAMKRLKCNERKIDENPVLKGEK